MTYHRFNLSNSSFEEIEVNKDNYKADMSENNLYKCNFGYSLNEMMKKTGFGERKTLKWLKTKKKEGKVRVIRIPITDISNRLNYTTVYVLEMDLNGSKE